MQKHISKIGKSTLFQDRDSLTIRFIGSVEDTAKWLNSKLNAWTKAISKLSFAAQDFPQAAFTSFTKSLQNEWAFLQRILQGTENFFSMLKTSITSEFLPSLFGLDLSASETELMHICADQQT